MFESPTSTAPGATGARLFHLPAMAQNGRPGEGTRTERLPLLTLYGNNGSGNDYKVRLLFAHLGIAYRRIEVWQIRDEPRSPEFLRVNPIGKVPAVVFDDGRVLSESGAILYYFAQDTDYWPADARGRAEALRWMFFEQYSHEPPIAGNRYMLRFLEDRRGLAERISANALKGTQALEAMESHLADRAWFAAGAYTIADMALYAYTHVAPEGGFDLEPFPRVRAWLARVAARPGHVGMGEERSATPPVPLSEADLTA